MKTKIFALLLAGVMGISLASCGGAAKASVPSDSAQASETAAVSDTEEKAVEKNGDIYILFTSDVHCGVNRGVGYAGLKRVKDTLEENGYETIMFEGAEVINDNIKLDNQALIDYIVDTLGGVVGEEYADLYGQGRITIL